MTKIDGVTDSEYIVLGFDVIATHSGDNDNIIVSRSDDISVSL
jgi:hypothetical protein